MKTCVTLKQQEVMAVAHQGQTVNQMISDDLAVVELESNGHRSATSQMVGGGCSSQPGLTEGGRGWSGKYQFFHHDREIHWMSLGDSYTRNKYSGDI